MSVDQFTISITCRRIPGFSRYFAGDNGSLWTDRNIRGNPCPVRQITGSLTRKGYLRAILQNDEGKSVAKLVHCLVLETFVGPCPDGMECCHFDGNKTNNCLDNLRWDTSKANYQDTVRLGKQRSLVGSNNGRARIDEPTVAKVKRCILDGSSDKATIERFRLTRNQYFKIKSGRSWIHVVAS